MALKKLFKLLPLFSVSLYGYDLDSSILSDLQRSSLQLQEKSVEHKTDKLYRSWLNPVTASYSYTVNNQNTENMQQSQNVVVSVDQPIFKSGGIYFALKYAEALRKEQKLSVREAEKMAIKGVLNSLFSLREIDFQIEKQRLVVANSEIDLQRKSEQYREGLLDSSFVDNALITKNRNQLVTIDLQNQRKGLILQLKELSDIENYRDVELPKLSILSEDEYLSNSLSLQRAVEDITVKKYYQSMQFSRYFPTISINGSYNYTDVQNPNFGSMTIPDYHFSFFQAGVKVSIPLLDFGRGYDYDSAKVDYLKSRIDRDDLQRKLSIEYQLRIDKIENVNSKIALVEKNIELYSNLLEETESLFSAGLKTPLDVQNLRNSIEINRLEGRILEVAKQKLLLELI
jgi:outer membrane protein TolC